MALGSLLWWNIPGTASVANGAFAQLLGDLAIDAPPPSVAPIDVFRRISSSATTEYDLDGAQVTLDCHPVDSQSTMLVRHVVRTVRVGGTQKEAKRVGDFAFYKPPRDRPTAARVRVTPMPGEHPDKMAIVSFVNSLRHGYESMLTTVDPQAIRRTVRTYLKGIGALYLEGPYFIASPGDAERLSTLLGSIEGCVAWHVSLPNDERSKNMLTQALTLTNPSDLTLGQLEALAPLGVVPESVWAAFEKETQ